MKKHLSLQRAIDIAMWMNFKHPIENKNYGVMKLKKSQKYKVVETKGRRKSRLIALPTDYSEMNYEQIKALCEDLDLLDYWDDIIALFSTTNVELLRFIIVNKVPLEKLIRFQLAASGHDKYNRFVGFEKARRIWQK